MSESRAPLLVVDGDNLAHRAFHSVPKSVVGAGGRPINAIVGWTNTLVNLWETEQPRAIFVGWDTLGVPTYRHTLLPEYQAGRVFEDAILEQLEALPGLTAAFGFGVAKEAGYEADDLMASAVARETGAGGSCLVLTNDRDSYQLVSGAVTVLSPKPGGGLVRIGPEQVVERFGVEPSRVPDFKALAGDPSDNIPGARGIGPKKAAALLGQYGSLDGVLRAWEQQGTPAEDGERLRQFREIATVRSDAPVVLPDGPPDWAGGAEALQEFGAGRAAERVKKLSAAGASPRLFG